MNNIKKIEVFDTTLRDGEQTPNVSFDRESKLSIIKNLKKMKIDVCEIGMPISSHKDFTDINYLTSQDIDIEFVALSTIKKTDILKTYECLKNAKKKRIHLVFATSEINLKYRFKINKEECLNIIEEGIKYSKKYFDTVQFAAEDATRTELSFLKLVYQKAIDSGATYLTIPDTVGICTPDEYGYIIKFLKQNLDYNENIKFSLHCHNDLGLATANTLSGILNGGDEIQCTINGIGERSGNCPLEEIVAILKYKTNKYYTVVNSKYLLETSKMVSKFSNIIVQANKAIVGDNSFKHASGIHQDGIIKNPKLYQFLNPEDFGIDKIELIIDKSSGRNGLKNKLKELNIDESKIDIKLLLENIKKNKIINDQIIIEEVNKIKDN